MVSRTVAPSNANGEAAATRLAPSVHAPMERDDFVPPSRDSLEESRSRSRAAAWNVLTAGKGVAAAKSAANRTSRLAPRGTVERERAPRAAAGERERAPVREPGEAGEQPAARRVREELGTIKPPAAPQRRRDVDPDDERLELAAERDEREDDELTPAERRERRAARDERDEDYDERPARRAAPARRERAASPEETEAAERALGFARRARLPEAAIRAMSRADLIAYGDAEAQRARTHQENTTRLKQYEGGQAPAPAAAPAGDAPNLNRGAADNGSAGAPARELDFTEDLADIASGWGSPFGEALNAATKKVAQRILAQVEERRGGDARFDNLNRSFNRMAERAVRAELRGEFSEVSKPDVWAAIKEKAITLGRPDAVTKVSPYAHLEDPVASCFRDAAMLVLGAGGSRVSDDPDNENDALESLQPMGGGDEEHDMPIDAESSKEQIRRRAFRDLSRGKSVSEVKRRLAHRR